jgi:CBS domain-containing protein
MTFAIPSRRRNVGAIPVVTPEGKVIGIVSYLDVLRGLTAQSS